MNKIIGLDVSKNWLDGTVKLSKIVSKRAIFLDFRQQEVFEWLRPKWI